MAVAASQHCGTTTRHQGVGRKSPGRTGVRLRDAQEGGKKAQADGPCRDDDDGPGCSGRRRARLIRPTCLPFSSCLSCPPWLPAPSRSRSSASVPQCLSVSPPPTPPARQPAAMSPCRPVCRPRPDFPSPACDSNVQMGQASPSSALVVRRLPVSLVRAAYPALCVMRPAACDLRPARCGRRCLHSCTATSLSSPAAGTEF
ncbi:hypothetical protein BS50DRAFT_302472 [Corynespora cassiicola Philippines]|uniref:Uncharacterized protein n=1 Tax=Corynespora cassiicola Philippines TaxID=1448308 RepID=A0A2T2NX54_CORCC|nr:hypothetical protein BS50DRAFT_302472 [Corynespora cassiicola Philippines]